MNTPGPPGHQAQVEAFSQRHRTGLVTLLFTDIVGSTQVCSPRLWNGLPPKDPPFTTARVVATPP